MRGANNTVLTLLALAVLGIAAYLLFQPAHQVVVQQASPTSVTAAAGAATEKNAPIWSVLVVLQTPDKTPVTDANVWLLYEKPHNIYETPTDNIAASATGVDASVVFDKLITGRSYFALAAAPGYYNGGVEFNLPNKYPANYTADENPYTVMIVMQKKGTILGVQVPLVYQGSAADIAKLVYNDDTGTYDTQFQFVASTDGEVMYNKVVLDLNTTALGSATIDKMTVKIGDKEFDYTDVTGSKTIEFDTPQVIQAGATLPVEISIDGTGIDQVSGNLFTVTLYDVQSGEWSATVQGPA